MAGRDTKDGEGLGEICLDPAGELQRGHSLTCDAILKSPLSLA